jgi:hypothetical protein
LKEREKGERETQADCERDIDRQTLSLRERDIKYIKGCDRVTKYFLLKKREPKAKVLFLLNIFKIILYSRISN